MCSRKLWKNTFSLAFVSFIMLFVVEYGQAQDGIAGINRANDLVRSYFERGILLLYAIGAVLGLVGAVKVYSKWSRGDPDTSTTAASWFGSCIFLVVVATVLKSFFGV